MAFDPSAFDNNDSMFDQSEFIVPASDTKGHSVMYHFRFPASMQRHMQQIVTSRKFPYITPSDLVRHALMRHFEWLEEITKSHPMPNNCRNSLALIRMEAEYVRSTMEEKEFDDHFQLVQKRVQELLAKKGGRAEALRTISRAISATRQMPSGFFRDQHLERLEENFGHLLDGGKMGKVNRATDEEEGEGAGDGLPQ